MTTRRSIRAPRYLPNADLHRIWTDDPSAVIVVAMFSAATLFFFGATLVALAVQTVGLGLFLRFCKKGLPPEAKPPFYPGVTVLKPCYAVEDGEEFNYIAFFNQDYPGPLHLLFVASDEDDPAVPLVRDFIQRHPSVDAELVISKTRNAYWAKIDAVYDGHLKAKHDVLIISDSDVRPRRDYVRQMVHALHEPGVSLVSTPQWDDGANNIGSAWKALGNNADSAVIALIVDAFSKKKALALGHSIGFRLSEFEKLRKDRWRVLNSFLAEDLAYAYLFSQAGKLAVLRNIYCPVIFANKTIQQVVSQKIRWVLNQKMATGNRYVYLGGMLLYPEISALFLCISSGFQGYAVGLFCLGTLLRIGISGTVEKLYLGSLRMNNRYFWTVPLWDMAQIYFFIHGFFKTTITYSGKTYRVVNRFFLEEVNAPVGVQSSVVASEAKQPQ